MQARIGRTPKTYVFRDERLTIKQIAERTGMSRSGAAKRISGERFLEKHELNALPSEPRVIDRMVFYRGRRMNLTAWARELGMSRSCLAYRLNQGWPVEAAFMTPLRSRTRIILMLRHNGKVMTLSKWAKAYGCHRGTLFRHVFVYGEPVHVALRKLTSDRSVNDGSIRADELRRNGTPGGYPTTSTLPKGTGGPRHARHADQSCALDAHTRALPSPAETRA